MWKNKIDPDRPLVIIRRKRIALWIPKATDTHSEYVILTAFSLQNWLHERVSLLRHTHIAGRVILSDHLRVSLRSGLLPLLPRVCYVAHPSHSPCLVTEYIVKDTNYGGPCSSVGIATEGWTVRDRIPVGTWFSAPVQTGPGAHPASRKMGTGSFPEVEAAGAWGWPLPLPKPKVLEESRAIPYSPKGPAWPIKRVKTYLPTNYEVRYTL